MYCLNCGDPMNDNASFCTKCGAVNDHAAAPSAAVTRPRKKHHFGWIVAPVIFLVLIGILLFTLYQMFWGSPRDLGVRYTRADYQRALVKVGLQVDFMGLSEAELADEIEANRDKEYSIDDYNWAFSNYEERSFELTPVEATAFINEIAPGFSWFEDGQIKVFSDGHSAGSYRVRFDKIKEELIPDVAGLIPGAVASFLPAAFNLYLEGDFEIIENEVNVPDKLDRLEIGNVALQPIIGDISNQDRAGIFDYTERIYRQIPDLMIHSLKINDEGNFAISAYMPTQVTITEK